ncbi:unnamed protein product [Prorocentrum cordatum]|uniref:Uncharacterized protein n=1 Tax=Prorocentrum cordatum TaxID=2364126 RepID=A0ABN9RYX5_9DINO|nr:unnamed protein product [Polarella glacialis]
MRWLVSAMAPKGVAKAKGKGKGKGKGRGKDKAKPKAAAVGGGLGRGALALAAGARGRGGRGRGGRARGGARGGALPGGRAAGGGAGGGAAGLAAVSASRPLRSLPPRRHLPAPWRRLAARLLGQLAGCGLARLPQAGWAPRSWGRSRLAAGETLAWLAARPQRWRPPWGPPSCHPRPCSPPATNLQ